MMKRVLLLLLLISLLTGCRKSAPPEEVQDIALPLVDEAVHTSQAHPLYWNQKEQEYIDQLRSEGILKITTRIRESVYEPDKYGEGLHGGLDYELISSFAELIGVDLDVELVDTFSLYFAHDGRVPDDAIQQSLVSGESPAYIPDSFQNSLILIDGFSWKDWRDPLAQFVPTFPDRDVVITRSYSGVSSLEDLKGKNLGIHPQANPSRYLVEALERNEIPVDTMVIESVDELPAALFRNEVDAVAIGGISSLFEMKHYSGLEIAFPVGQSLSWSHWLVQKDNLILAGILEKYILYAKDKGVISEAWERQFHFSYNDFLYIITMD
ncbi:MAG: ABC transporter substrate-binding protein [Spirochaetales bacterium]|nr:ABC transporter substrate-binding protein [Spirochaetales bacterium]